MKKILLSAIIAAATSAALAQGWPADYKGVMLQGFYWDSYDDTRWTVLEAQADELSEYFNLIWVPQSGWTGSTTSMGYNDIYWYNQRSAFGSESELKSMIQTFKQKGTGIIADVVINHRGGVSRWTDFPTEVNPLDGKTYSMGLSDICSTDDYNTSTDASAVSERATYGKATGAADTGDDFAGYRDLDHTNANVQDNCKAYTKYLLDYLGYTGFRYDMVKGYAAQYVGMYNTYSNPTYSVGECWDSKSTIKNWIDGTATNGAIQSAAFDFPQKYLMNNNTNNYANWYDTSNSLATDDTYSRYGVTFVDNHDSYRDTNKFTGDVLAANAWILALPGTPCVFLPHWQEYKGDIEKMIKVRKMVGVSNTSTTTVRSKSNQYITIETTGENGKLVAIVGSVGYGTSQWNPASYGYKLLVKGSTYAYYVNSDFTATATYVVDQASGSFDNNVTVNVTPIGGTIVYTTDGTTPSATNGTQATAATALTFTTTTTLMVGVLVNGSVQDVRTYTYTISAFEPYQITVYVNGDNVGWASYINFWTWGGDGSHAPKNSSWPGDKVTSSTTVNGKKWFTQTYTINASDDYVSFVFSTGTGSPQTVDVANVNKDSYFEVSTTQTTGKYEVNDVTSSYTAIESVVTDGKEKNDKYWYSLSGIRFSSKPQKAGIYVHSGKKVVVR